MSKEDSKYVFGIDLGTTYSCISYVDETGRAVIIQNKEGTDSTPSVVYFASPTNIVVGEIAKDTATLYPDKTVSFVKTLMGKTDFAIEVDGKAKSPEEVSAHILTKLALDAEKQISSKVKDIIITCPAYFGHKERTATINAGEIAGFNVLGVISEPTAAALYYGCMKEQEKKTILVYDLGGGTFDVTIMSIDANNIKMICSDGNPELGGKNWDEVLMGYLESEFKSQTGFTGEFDIYAQQNLRLEAEKAKRRLSGVETTLVMLDAEGKRAAIEVTRAIFDEITSDLLHQTITITDKAIEIAKGEGYATIDEILLVGGSTIMVQVPEALQKKYGLEPKILEPAAAVAKGAAHYAVDVYNDNKKLIDMWREKGGKDAEKPKIKGNYDKELTIALGPGSSVGKINITYSTTKSYALEVVVHGEPKCHNLIIKNKPMPEGIVRVTDEFGTLNANQPGVEMKVYENDFMETQFEIDERYLLGSALFDLPKKNLPKGAPLEVTFSLSNEGILTLTGKDTTNDLDLTCNGKNYATIEAYGFLSEEDVEALKEKFATSIAANKS